MALMEQDTPIARISGGASVSTGDNGWKWRRLEMEKILLWIVLGTGAIAMVGPFYWMFIGSFKTRTEMSAIPPTWFPQTITGENWANLSLPPIIGSLPTVFGNSVFVTLTVTVITLFTSSLAGYVFAKFDFRGKNLLFWIVVSMLIVPFSVTLIPLSRMVSDWGWRNNYLALIVPILFSPFGIFLMRQQIANIPNDLIDAARMDGANEYLIYFRIILPLCGAALAALAIFTFTFQWDNFLWPLVNLDDPSLYTIPLWLGQFRGRTSNDSGPLMAASFISVLPIIVVYFFAQRRFIEGIALTGLKG